MLAFFFFDWTYKAAGVASPGSLEEDSSVTENGKTAKKAGNLGVGPVAKELSDLVNYCQATKFRGLRCLPSTGAKQRSGLLKVLSPIF